MKSTLAVLAAAILLLLAAALLASSWINRDAGKREIDAAFARVTGGSATYERIDFNFLPSPGAVVSRPRISTAGVSGMQAESMSVRFDVLALLAGRDTGAMALLLAVHLGVVLAFFATMPYGKFAHGIYRMAALLKWSIERRQPNPLKLSED